MLSGSVVNLELHSNKKCLINVRKNVDGSLILIFSNSFNIHLRLAGWGFSARVGFSSGGGVFQPRWGFLGITGGGLVHYTPTLNTHTYIPDFL